MSKSSVNEPIERPISLQDAAYARLREIVLSGEIGPGEPVTLRELADRLGVSTMPIREAARRLEGEGLLSFDPGRRIVVAALTMAEMSEVFGIRLRLEPWAAEMAAHRISARELEELDRLVDQMQESLSGQMNEWRELNYRFHMGIYRGSGMERLERVIAPLFASVEGYLRLYVNTAESLDRPQDEHRALVDALRNGDGQLAGQITAQHLSATMESLIPVLDGSGREALQLRSVGDHDGS
jgi:DNA-binding GntR family transcriptional regulator